MIISERVYDSTSQDQTRPIFQPTRIQSEPTTIPTEYHPVNVFNTSRLEAEVRQIVEDTQRAAAQAAPVLPTATIEAIQEAITSTATKVPTRLPSTSTPIPITPARSIASLVILEPKSPTTAPITVATATKVPEVEKKVQPATLTARPIEVKPRGGFNITKGEIEELRLIRDGRPYSCMEFLGDIEVEMGDLGRGVVVTMNGIVAAESSCDPDALSVAGSEGLFQIHRGSHQSWVERMFGMPFSRAVREIKTSAQIARKIFLDQGYQAWDVCGLGYKRFLKPVLDCLRYSS